MHLAKVIGRVVATVKHEALTGVKLLLIQPIDDKGAPKGEPIVATDSVQSGPGDLVTYVSGREGTLALDEPFTPVDAGIVGIVDSVNRETP
ncbi:MAG: EutN/CcmL family microcompartment protein [Nitrospinae bacterium]|nr:EutN/CcmL family microcompartment protein [Nitrospinota bacterium]